MRSWIVKTMSALALAMPVWAHALEVESVQLDDAVTVGGQKLVLNGAGFRKRGYFKTDVQAVYVGKKETTLEGLVKQPGPKRITIYVLKEIPGATISRYFVGDFKLVTTDAEFKALINEIGIIGSVYGGLHKVNKGDIVNIDWVPGKGIMTLFNGKPIVLENGQNSMNTPNAELMYQIFLRIYTGPAVPEELRLNLLGLSKSMSTATVQGER